nr:reverse transcriptase domain-containing protein [Tanacetum cinerariifolium]
MEIKRKGTSAHGGVNGIDCVRVGCRNYPGGEGEWIMKKEMRMISKDVIISKFHGYTSSKEEDEEEDEKEESEKKGLKEAGSSNDKNPDITTIIVQQLQNILHQIVTQVTNNVNNANANGGNGGNENGGNNGCSYKTFLACNLRDYDGKGGAVALTRWTEKMESVIENSGCAKNQKVKYAASSFINKA